MRSLSLETFQEDTGVKKDRRDLVNACSGMDFCKNLNDNIPHWQRFEMRDINLLWRVRGDAADVVHPVEKA